MDGGGESPVAKPGVTLPGVSLAGVATGFVPGAGLPGVGVAGVGVQSATPPSQSVLRDLVVGVGASEPQNFTDVGSNVFFTANNAANGRELWKSDGTAAGTGLVKDIRLGSIGSNPARLTNVNGRLMFAASDGIVWAQAQP